MRENIHKLRIEAPPTDDTAVEKNFADNTRQIKKKWYKEQHRQLKVKLAQAQERGNEELLEKLMYEKQNLMIQEKELR